MTADKAQDGTVLGLVLLPSVVCSVCPRISRDSTKSSLYTHTTWSAFLSIIYIKVYRYFDLLFHYNHDNRLQGDDCQGYPPGKYDDI